MENGPAGCRVRTLNKIVSVISIFLKDYFKVRLKIYQWYKELLSYSVHVVELAIKINFLNDFSSIDWISIHILPILKNIWSHWKRNWKDYLLIVLLLSITMRNLFTQQHNFMEQNFILKFIFTSKYGWMKYKWKVFNDNRT